MSGNFGYFGSKNLQNLLRVFPLEIKESAQGFPNLDKNSQTLPITKVPLSQLLGGCDVL